MVVNQLKGNINIRNNRGTEIEFSFSKAANNSVLQDISN
jgi:two-component sensor histidine kinase